MSMGSKLALKLKIKESVHCHNIADSHIGDAGHSVYKAQEGEDWMDLVNYPHKARHLVHLLGEGTCLKAKGC